MQKCSFKRFSTGFKLTQGWLMQLVSSRRAQAEDLVTLWHLLVVEGPLCHQKWTVGFDLSVSEVWPFFLFFISCSTAAMGNVGKVFVWQCWTVNLQSVESVHCYWPMSSRLHCSNKGVEFSRESQPLIGRKGGSYKADLYRLNLHWCEDSGLVPLWTHLTHDCAPQMPCWTWQRD